MPKVRIRRLWLNVLWDDDRIPDSYSREDIVRTLIRSIKRGDYRIPRGWRVVIEWRNKADEPMRRGEWRTELERSAESSTGFDSAVLAYLEKNYE